MKLKPPTVLRSRKVRTLVAVGAVFAGLSSLALAQTTPALADPTEQLVVVGSDTIQDVWNQFALDSGGNLIGSYNAVNPVTNVPGEDITPVDGTSGANCAFVRPNGSGGGLNAFKYSLGDHGSGVVAGLTPGTTGQSGQTGGGLPGAGCIDIARSSSAPSGGGYTGTDALQYIPFAEDAVAPSVGPATTQAGDAFDVNGITVTPTATHITDADLFTVAQLTHLYSTCTEVTLSDGTVYWPRNGLDAQPSGSHVIDLYVPQAGSGTRNFWAQTLGNFPAGAGALPQCVFDHIQAGPLAAPAVTGGFQVEEHDGTAVASDPDGIGPFSIAQYIAQTSGFNDRHHDATIHNVDGVAPTVGGGLNASYPINRLVFNIVQKSRVTAAGDPLNNLLNGSGSVVCNDKGTILQFGFALIGNQCGQVLTANAIQP